MKALKSILIGVGAFALCALFLNLFSFYSSSAPDNEEANDNIEQRRAYIRENYKVFSVPPPIRIDFAGEEVPLQDVDVQERLDKELIINTYWHSHTILFHKRAHRWFPMIEKILNEEGIPDDFKYLCVIESGLENVVSYAGATGFWQFMESTGDSYGLEINDEVDERYHVEKSTRAACKYLKNAYKQFGNWTLAAASYNMGMGGVSKRLSEQKADNYYDLLLNSETSRYCFRILAAKHVLTHSSDFGFNLIESDLYQPYELVTITVDSSISSLTDFAKSQGSNYKILKRLNPWLRSKELKNKNGKEYEFLFPAKSENLKPMSSY